MKPPTKRLEHASIYPSNYVKEVNVFLSILNNTILVPICASFSVQTHQIELISNCGRIFLRLNFFLLFVCQNYVIFFRCDMQKKRPPTVRNVYCYHPTYISICFLYFVFLSKPQRRPLWTITFSSNIHFVKMASQRSESVDGREPTGYTDRKR